MNLLEREAIECILKLEAPEHPELLAQLQTLRVTERRYTGVGVFTELKTEDASLRCINCSTRVLLGGQVFATVGAIKEPIGFVLYVEGGFIMTLECHTYAQKWPDDATQVFCIEPHMA